MVRRAGLPEPQASTHRQHPLLVPTSTSGRCPPYPLPGMTDCFRNEDTMETIPAVDAGDGGSFRHVALRAGSAVRRFFVLPIRP